MDNTLSHGGTTAIGATTDLGMVPQTFVFRQQTTSRSRRRESMYYGRTIAFCMMPNKG